MTSDWLCSYSWLFSGLQTEEILKKGKKKKGKYTKFLFGFMNLPSAH